MQVVGFQFTKISGEKKKQAKGNVKINSNIDIDDVKKEKLSLFPNKEILKFSFTFSIKYDPSLGEIEFKGDILTLVENKEEKDILKKFKKKKIDDKYRIPLFNLILTRTSISALQLEEDLQLPPHIPLPKVKTGQNQANYTG